MLTQRAQLLGRNTATMRNGGGSTANAKKDDNMSEQARLMLEEANNKEISDLSNKVNLMKNLAIDIESQIGEDHKLLDQTSNSFEKVLGMMKGTLGNVNKMLATGGSKHMCYLILFIVGLFLVLYWLMK